MTNTPANPKIYHITHVGNLVGILNAGVIWSDSRRIALGIDCSMVGLHGIKRRRMQQLIVKCHPHTKVGDYVPFYFCPRSVMLYILHRANSPELTYRDGQRPMIHLEADLRSTVQWAEANGRRWAFSNRNAGANYADFFADLGRLDEVNWAAVANTDFRDPAVKEGKQAEFLVHDSVPTELIERIGVIDDSTRRQVTAILSATRVRPIVAVLPGWYF